MRILGLFVLLLSLNSFAVGPCHSDAEKLCKDVKGGEGRIMKCLKDNKDSVSAECKEHIEGKKEKFKAAMKEVSEACSADREKFCADVRGGKGRILKCLKQNEAQVSEQCKAELAERKRK